MKINSYLIIVVGLAACATGIVPVYAADTLLAGYEPSETDRKVEIRHEWMGFTFDLLGEDRILVDVYMTSQLSPSLAGIWDDVFGWYQALSVPPNPNEWYTISFDVSGNTEVNLDHIAALIFEGMGVDDGTIYFDNLRLVHFKPDGLIATGHDSRIDLRWEPVSALGLDGYNIYHSRYVGGTT